ATGNKSNKWDDWYEITCLAILKEIFFDRYDGKAKFWSSSTPSFSAKTRRRSVYGFFIFHFSGIR
ncbi:MAG: hypothetical protein J6Y78_06955, partial [Paludibacteraceae bacterium]|nr:hypothetical protein [Paludibacteraceae bacterium]